MDESIGRKHRLRKLYLPSSHPKSPALVCVCVFQKSQKEKSSSEKLLLIGEMESRESTV